MKTIGLIGGMSWESSKLYYELINRKVKEVLGGSHSAKSLMVSVDFGEIERLTFADKWDEMGELIAKNAKQLEKGGADIILLCTNTIHLVSNYIVDNTSIPFMHIAEATGKAIQKKGLKKVALLGTRFTMEKDFYTKILTEKFGLEVITPVEEGRQTIHDMIYDELVLGVLNPKSKQACIDIIADLEQAGAEGVILGCTEIPLLISQADVNIPTFDTAQIHAHEAVEWALQG